MRDQLRIGGPLSWIVAWLLALAGPVIFLLEPSSSTWWAWLLVAPLVALAIWREERKGMGGDGPTPLDAGPYGPPPGL